MPRTGRSLRRAAGDPARPDHLPSKRTEGGGKRHQNSDQSSGAAATAVLPTEIRGAGAEGDGAEYDGAECEGADTAGRGMARTGADAGA